MEFDIDFNLPKSIFEDDVTMNGSCSLWVSCAETMDNQSNGGEAGGSPFGACCSGDVWIGTTLGDGGMDPFDDMWRIGTFIMVIALVNAASVLETWRSSMTSVVVMVKSYALDGYVTVFDMVVLQPNNSYGDLCLHGLPVLWLHQDEQRGEAQVSGPLGPMQKEKIAVD